MKILKRLRWWWIWFWGEEYDIKLTENLKQGKILFRKHKIYIGKGNDND